MCVIAWYNEYLGLNPRQRMLRDLVVRYADEHGGAIDEYLREVYPRYWQKVEWRESFDKISEDLRLTRSEEARVLADMAKVVVPALRATFPADSASLRLPEGVAHL